MSPSRMVVDHFTNEMGSEVKVSQKEKRSKCINTVKEFSHLSLKISAVVKSNHVRAIEEITFNSRVGPRLIGPIRTEDFSPLSQDNL